MEFNDEELEKLRQASRKLKNRLTSLQEQIARMKGVPEWKANNILSEMFDLQFIIEDIGNLVDKPRPN